MSLEIVAKDFKLLIVDDVMSNVILLKSLLVREGYNIAIASDGVSALAALKTEKPDLILLDVMMPGMSGYEVGKKIREESEYSEFSETPIIYLTGLNSSSDIVDGFKSGGNDFISKPFNKEELLIRISHQLYLVSAKRIITRQTEELRNTIVGRDRLYSVIAHDLRSPIGSVKMVLNMLAMNLTKEKIGDDLYDFLNVANQTIENTFSLLDNLLKWTKSQVGKLNVVYQNTDIVEVLADTVDTFKLVAQIKKLNLEFHHDVSIHVRMDIDMIKTVLRNLLSNAIKFSHEGGRIDVTLSEDSDFAIISVKDCGTGIKEEDKVKLFNMSTHFTTFGTANEEGSGLGLLLVKDFVTKNGGTFKFESEYGKGSTFSFTVPKAK
jgi:two-component system, sensor histidine kinase and response regulator